MPSLLFRLREAENPARIAARCKIHSDEGAVLSTDIAGNVTYLNKAAEEMTGWSFEEATGRPLFEVFRIIEDVTREPARNPMAQAGSFGPTRLSG